MWVGVSSAHPLLSQGLKQFHLQQTNTYIQSSKIKLSLQIGHFLHPYNIRGQNCKRCRSNNVTDFSLIVRCLLGKLQVRQYNIHPHTEKFVYFLVCMLAIGDVLLLFKFKCTSLIQDTPAMFNKQSNDAKLLDWINIALVWQTTPQQKLELQIPTMQSRNKLL